MRPREGTALAALPVALCVPQPERARSFHGSAIPEHDAGVLVNDVHSQLNATRVASIVKPHTVDELQRVIVEAKAAGRSISIAGGRHAMGGQQFGEENVLVDLRRQGRPYAGSRTHRPAALPRSGRCAAGSGELIRRFGDNRDWFNAARPGCANGGHDFWRQIRTAGPAAAQHQAFGGPYPRSSTAEQAPGCRSEGVAY
jgi:hypothetical protein